MCATLHYLLQKLYRHASIFFNWLYFLNCSSYAGWKLICIDSLHIVCKGFIQRCSSILSSAFGRTFSSTSHLMSSLAIHLGKRPCCTLHPSPLSAGVSRHPAFIMCRRDIWLGNHQLSTSMRTEILWGLRALYGVCLAPGLLRKTHSKHLPF